jgi:DNA-binding NtrC family response regulator
MESKHHILLVDDSTEIVEALKSFLSLNYIVHTASNGLDGVNRACVIKSGFRQRVVPRSLRNAQRRGCTSGR